MNNNTMTDKENSQSIQGSSWFIEGVRSAVPIALGYIPIAISFGILSKSVDVPNYISILMSLLVFAGAGQFMAANLIVAGASFYEIILAEFILNLRHFLYTSFISQRLEGGLSNGWLAFLSFGITDETFTVASLREEKNLSRFFLLGLNLTALFGWVFGTAIGVFLGDLLPVSLGSSMGIALYSMFIALLVPSLKKSKAVLTAAGISMVCHSLIKLIPGLSKLSSGWSIIISTIIAALLCTIIFPKGVNKDE